MYSAIFDGKISGINLPMSTTPMSTWATYAHDQPNNFAA